MWLWPTIVNVYGGHNPYPYSCCSQLIVVIGCTPHLRWVLAVQYDGDISAYTVEKTMDMENRIKAMRELHGAKHRPSLQMSVTGTIL